MPIEKYCFLDIGGGSEWRPEVLSIKSIDNISEPRAAKFARNNPNSECFIFDIYFPPQIAKQLTLEIPNLYLIQAKLEASTYIPFIQNSMDRVEMNHMFTPLSADIDLYRKALWEASRVLKLGGILSLTEKKERIDNILKILMIQSGQYDTPLIEMLGMSPDYTITEVTDKNRTLFTSLAFDQRELESTRSDYSVFTLEMKKRS